MQIRIMKSNGDISVAGVAVALPAALFSLAWAVLTRGSCEGHEYFPPWFLGKASTHILSHLAPLSPFFFFKGGEWGSVEARSSGGTEEEGTVKLLCQSVCLSLCLSLSLYKLLCYTFPPVLFFLIRLLGSLLMIWWEVKTV